MRWEPQNGIVFVALVTIALLWLGYGFYVAPFITLGVVTVVGLIASIVGYMTWFNRGAMA